MVDLGAPYRAVIPSLDGPVLRVLAGAHRPLTGLAVHRLAGTASSGGVRKVLNRLVGHGLVTVTRAGASLLYEANRNHLAWPAVEQLITMPTQLVDRLRALVATWTVAPACVGLFGSAARGDGTTSSDIDLLVVPPEDIPVPSHTRSPLRSRTAQEQRSTTWSGQVEELRLAAFVMTGNHAQVLELSGRVLVMSFAADEPIVAQWRQDLIVLGGQAPWVVVEDVTRRAATDQAPTDQTAAGAVAAAEVAR